MGLSFSMLKWERFPAFTKTEKEENNMSKMNYRRGMRGARRGKMSARMVPEGFMTKAKRMHRRAVRRAGKVEISISLALDGDYVPELKARDVLRIAKKSPRAMAYWMVY